MAQPLLLTARTETRVVRRRLLRSQAFDLVLQEAVQEEQLVQLPVGLPGRARLLQRLGAAPVLQVALAAMVVPPYLAAAVAAAVALLLAT